MQSLVFNTHIRSGRSGGSLGSGATGLSLLSALTHLSLDTRLTVGALDTQRESEDGTRLASRTTVPVRRWDTGGAERRGALTYRGSGETSRPGRSDLAAVTLQGGSEELG